jgi:hypothetical protein
MPSAYKLLQLALVAIVLSALVLAADVKKPAVDRVGLPEG